MDSEDTPIRGKAEDTDDFTAFVQNQVSYMKGFLQLGAKKEISYYELQEALVGYADVHLTLTSLYNLARIEHQKAEKDFDMWFGEKFIEVRSEVNRPELTAQKWAGQREIEMMTRNKNKEVYNIMKDTLIELDNKVHFIKGLVDMWSQYQWTLKTLSDNIRSESGSMNMENRLSH